MLAIYALYFGLALIRELLVVRYYRAIYRQLALSASALSLGIELLDLYVVATIVARFVTTREWLPGLVYAVGGTFGVYIGLRGNAKSGHHSGSDHTKTK